jgi:hypothetical protein
MALTFTFAGDEAGDFSFNFEKGASRYLVIAVIATPEPDKLRDLLADIRKENRLSPSHEFGFHNISSAQFRARIFNALHSANFEVWALIADKTTLPETFRLFMSGLDAYAYFVSEVIRRIPLEKRTGATLILDEFGNPEQTRDELKRVFKKLNVKHGFNRISMRRSKQEALIQIADLIAGSILRRDAHNQSEAYDLIADKIVELIEHR